MTKCRIVGTVELLNAIGRIGDQQIGAALNGRIGPCEWETGKTDCLDVSDMALIHQLFIQWGQVELLMTSR